MTWQLLNENENEMKGSLNGSASPRAREMHSMCCYDGILLVIGGRDYDGNILSDVWMLQCVEVEVEVEVDNHLEETLFSPPILIGNHTLNVNQTENEEEENDRNDIKNENEIGKMGNKTLSVKNEEINLKSSCIIQELDLSTSTSQCSSVKHKTQENMKSNSVNISPKVKRKYKLIWHEMTMLKLPAGRCAHTSSIIHNEIYIIGGVEEDSGLTDSVIKIPYPVSFPVSMKSSMKNKSMKEFNSIDMNSYKDKEVKKGSWVDISTQINKTIHNKISLTTIGARFGHCACILSYQMSTGMHNNTTSQQRTQQEQQQTQHTTNSIHNYINDDEKEPNSFLVFGGVCAEKDFSDFVLLNF